MKTNRPRASDCVRAVVEAVQRNDVAAQAHAIDVYLSKTDQGSAAYRKQKQQKLIELAIRAGVLHPVVDLVRARPVGGPTPAAPATPVHAIQPPAAPRAHAAPLNVPAWAQEASTLPVVERTNDAGLDAMLRKLSVMGRDVTAWTRIRDEYVFVHAPFKEPSDDGMTPGYGGLFYRVVTVPVAARLDLLDDLEQAHQEIVGLSVAPGDDDLMVLVRPLRHGALAPPVRFVVQQRPALSEFGQAEYICGAAWRAGDTFSAPEGRHEIFFAARQSTRRCMHTSVVGTAGSLSEIVQAAHGQQHEVCGILMDSGGYTIVLMRGSVDDPPDARTLPGGDAQRVRTTRTSVLSGNDEVALEALQALACKHSVGHWQRHASTLHELLSNISADPCAALTRLACIASSATGPFGFDMKWLLKRWCERVIAEPEPSLLHKLRAQVPKLTADVRDTLRGQLLWACSQTTNEPRLALETIIARNWVARAAIASAVCGDEVYEVAVGMGSIYELACATGNPCIAAAVDGDVNAPAAWRRMTRQQRRIITVLGAAAHKRSVAARARLEARVAALLPTTDVREETENLRRYLRRQADVWINFKLESCITNATNYLPNSQGRDELERKRFSGLYHRPENLAEQRPIYVTLNGQKAPYGFPKFGRCAVILDKSVRSRLTIVARCLHDDGKQVGTLHAIDHVLVSLPNNALVSLFAAMHGSKMLRPRLKDSTDHVPSHVIEGHLHGPLSLFNEARKFVALTSALPSPQVVVKLREMASQLNHPLRWRGEIEIESAQPAHMSTALDLASEVGSRITAWVPGQSPLKQIFHVQGSSDGRTKSPYRYDLLTTTLKSFAARIGGLARESSEIAAFRVADYNGRVAQSARKVDAIVRKRDGMGTERVVGLRRTFSLTDKLQQLADTHWRVQAITGVRVPDSTTPLYHIVVEHVPGERFVSRIVSVERADSQVVENTVAELRRDAWTWVGFANYVPEGRSSMLFQRAADPIAPRPTLSPYVNGETLISDDPISTVPPALLFVSCTNHAFDIDELMDVVETRGAWVNPYTSQPFSDADVARLLAHPSGAGPAMAARLASESNGIEAISDATAQRIITMGRVLEVDDTEGTLDASTRVVDAFQTYVRTLGAAEQTALFGARFQLVDTHRSVFALSVMQALVGVQAHTGCSRATGRYLQQMGWAVTASRSVLSGHSEV